MKGNEMLIRLSGDDHNLTKEEQYAGLKQIQNSLDRFMGHIKTASLRLTHTKETQGDNNKSCQAIIHLNSGDEIIIEKKHNHFSGAMSLVSKALKNSLSKTINMIPQKAKGRKALKHNFLEIPQDEF